MKKLITLLLAGGLAVTGCGVVGDESIRITAEFEDVLDLVPQAAVKVNDVTVGSIKKITLRDWTAVVELTVDRSIRLPDNATAAIRQTSLLGEKFVELAAPGSEAATGELSDGDVIPLSRTRRSAEVEEVLSALGLVLNGSGLAHLKTINTEVALALAGREDAAKDALHQLDEFVAGLDDQQAEIIALIEALDRLSARLAAERDTIGAAVEALDPGLSTLAGQREQLTEALVALNDLGDVATGVIADSRDDLLANLEALQPLLDQLVQAGDDLPEALDFMLTYPFPPNITGAIHGNQVNLHVTLDLDATSVLANLLAAGPVDPIDLPVDPIDPLLPLPTPSLPGLPLPTLPPLPLPTLPLTDPESAPDPLLTPLPPLPTLLSSDLYRLLAGGLR